MKQKKNVYLYDMTFHYKFYKDSISSRKNDEKTLKWIFYTKYYFKKTDLSFAFIFLFFFCGIKIKTEFKKRIKY